MAEELTAAEQAAAEAIRDYVGTLVTSTGRSTDTLARTVVAAVRPVIAAQELDAAAGVLFHQASIERRDPHLHAQHKATGLDAAGRIITQRVAAHRSDTRRTPR